MGESTRIEGVMLTGHTRLIQVGFHLEPSPLDTADTAVDGRGPAAVDTVTCLLACRIEYRING